MSFSGMLESPGGVNGSNGKKGEGSGTDVMEVGGNAIKGYAYGVPTNVEGFIVKRLVDVSYELVENELSGF